MAMSTAWTLLFLPPAVSAEPAPSRSALFRPTFLWAERSQTAGQAFLISVPHRFRSEIFLVSCFHVLGDRPAELIGVAAISAETPPRMISSALPLPNPRAARVHNRSAAGDLSLFRIRASERAATLHLASQSPKVNERVWLFAQAFGEARARLHGATIRGVTREYLDYVFDESEVEFGGTSGAPILNEAGEVVGINVSGGKSGGELHGYANPAVNIVEALR
jgi:hypothetical protein